MGGRENPQAQSRELSPACEESRKNYLHKKMRVRKKKNGLNSLSA